MSSTDSVITFYRLQACPFCERVARVLNDLGLEYRSRFVEARHSRRDVVKRLTGSRTVPAVVDSNTGVTMSESANIVEYLETTYGESEAPEEPRTDGGTVGGDGQIDPEHVTASAAAGGEDE